MKWYWILGIIIIIFAGILIWNYSHSNKAIQEGKTLSEKIEDCQNNATCVTNLGIEYKNDSICGALTSYEYERGCQLNVLIAEGNISDCGKSYYYTTCEQAILNKTNKSA